jgi:hypothetical protein
MYPAIMGTPPINPLAVKAGLYDMFVVAETMAAKSTMKFLQSPVSFSVGAIGPITRTNGWKNGTGTMHQSNHLIM